MPVAPDFPLPRRYNSLRLQGFDYSNTASLFFISINTDRSRSVFGDFKLAKLILAALLDDHTLARIRVHAYTLLPDHFHLLAGVRDPTQRLSGSLGYFKSYTTSRFWKVAVSCPAVARWSSRARSSGPSRTVRHRICSRRRWSGALP